MLIKCVKYLHCDIHWMWRWWKEIRKSSCVIAFDRLRLIFSLVSVPFFSFSSSETIDQDRPWILKIIFALDWEENEKHHLAWFLRDDPQTLSFVSALMIILIEKISDCISVSSSRRDWEEHRTHSGWRWRLTLSDDGMSERRFAPTNPFFSVLDLENFLFYRSSQLDCRRLDHSSL